MKRLDEICEAFLEEAMDLNDLPGLVIGVSCRGQVWKGARGVRDVLTGDPLRADDVFHCASVSKLFTSAAVMKLAEAGVLNLNDRLCDLLPDLFPGTKAGHADKSANDDARYEDIRIWQMLSHTAGIGDVTEYHWEQALTADDALADYVHSPEVAEQPLLWAPGQGGFRYSNNAYEILGHLVSRYAGAYEKTGGEGLSDEDLSYEDFVRRYLMEPAGMTDSTMKTFERFGIKPADTCPLLTDLIRERNAGSAQECPDGQTPVGGIDQEKRLSEASGRSVWHPMALPHEKADDRSIVPVKYYPYTRSHAPSSTLTSTVTDLLRWAGAHMKGFAAVEAADRDSAGSQARDDQTGSCPAAGLQDAGQLKAADAPQDVQTAASEALLTFDSYQHIHYEYATVPNNGEKMGLGWFMRRQKGYQLYGHEGTDDGFRASLWICPALDLAIVVLSNLSGAPVKKLNKKLFDRLVK